MKSNITLIFNFNFVESIISPRNSIIPDLILGPLVKIRFASIFLTSFPRVLKSGSMSSVFQTLFNLGLTLFLLRCTILPQSVPHSLSSHGPVSSVSCWSCDLEGSWHRAWNTVALMWRWKRERSWAVNIKQWEFGSRYWETREKGRWNCEIQQYVGT